MVSKQCVPYVKKITINFVSYVIRLVYIDELDNWHLTNKDLACDVIFGSAKVKYYQMLEQLMGDKFFKLLIH